MLDITIAFDAPCDVDDTFDFIADRFFENHRRWDPAIVELRKLSSGAVGVGTRGVEVRRFITHQDAEFEVTAFDRPTRFAFVNTTGPFHLDRSYTFAATANGSRVEFRFRMNPRHRAIKLGWRLLRPVVAGQVRTNIDRLARLLGSPHGVTAAGGLVARATIPHRE